MNIRALCEEYCNVTAEDGGPYSVLDFAEWVEAKQEAETQAEITAEANREAILGLTIRELEEEGYTVLRNKHAYEFLKNLDAIVADKMSVLTVAQIEELGFAVHAVKHSGAVNKL